MFGGGGSTSLFLDLEARRELGMAGQRNLDGRRGWTDFAGGEFQTALYSFDLAKIGLSTSGPARLADRSAAEDRKGGIAMMLPTSYDYATESETITLSRLSFAPSGREVDASSAIRPRG